MYKSIQKLLILAFITSLGLLISCSGDSKDDNRNPVVINKKNDTALLLCAFGSTYEQPQATYEKIINNYKQAFPNTDIYLSFTSSTIVSRVYAQLGIAYAQPDIWLKAIGQAGYSAVYVQSLHIIPGEEYLGLMNNDVKKKFMVPFPNVKVAKSPCLLETEQDVEAVAQVLYSYYKPKLDNGEVVAMMGHGNPDAEYTHANLRYTQLEAMLQELSGEKNFFIGTVDWGESMFSHLREGIVEYAASKNKNNKDIVINLAPLMSIAGDHAQNDLLGDLEEDQKDDEIDPYEDDEDAEFSWKLKLEKLGFVISKEGSLTSPKEFNVIGLADHEGIRAIWVDHMKEAIKHAESWNGHLGE